MVVVVGTVRRRRRERRRVDHALRVVSVVGVVRPRVRRRRRLGPAAGRRSALLVAVHLLIRRARFFSCAKPFSRRRRTRGFLPPNCGAKSPMLKFPLVQNRVGLTSFDRSMRYASYSVDWLVGCPLASLTSDKCAQTNESGADDAPLRLPSDDPSEHWTFAAKGCIVPSFRSDETVHRARSPWLLSFEVRLGTPNKRKDPC